MDELLLQEERRLCKKYGVETIKEVLDMQHKILEPYCPPDTPNTQHYPNQIKPRPVKYTK